MMEDIHLMPGLTLLDAYRVAQHAGMHLIDNGLGDVRVSPIIPPGWREIPLRIKDAAAARGDVCTDQQVVA